MVLSRNPGTVLLLSAFPSVRNIAAIKPARKSSPKAKNIREMNGLRLSGGPRGIANISYVGDCWTSISGYVQRSEMIETIVKRGTMRQHPSLKEGKCMRTANLSIALALVAVPAHAQTVPDLPTNALKAIDGDWYGVDHKIKLSVTNGVVTIVENGTTDPYLRKIAAPAGTVIARITGVESTGPKSARFVGQCLELIDTSRSDTLPCPAHSFVQSAAYGGKPGLKINFWTAAFLRKGNIPEYQWQYRK